MNNKKLDITLEEAEKLSMETDYAFYAVGEEVNVGDAGAFFLEGYNEALKRVSEYLAKERSNIILK